MNAEWFNRKIVCVKFEKYYRHFFLFEEITKDLNTEDNAVSVFLLSNGEWEKIQKSRKFYCNRCGNSVPLNKIEPETECYRVLAKIKGG